MSPANHTRTGLATSDAFPEQKDHVTTVQNRNRQKVQNGEVDAEESEEHQQVDQSSAAALLVFPALAGCITLGSGQRHTAGRGAPWYGRHDRISVFSVLAGCLAQHGT